ncbi:hypothetical protein C2E23DRAFT_883567 [Lenzites betulinus]|nr:hypothetical protein C2E23DRAFT_883567 [Lenzites betulinus]
MASVDRLPSELWCEIIALACVDGGFTGRSLALTSKFFHAQSLSDRFHSLSICSASQVEAFLEFLRLQPKECHPRIKHLYLFLPNHQATTVYYGERVMDKRMEKFHTALTALLAVAAPHLNTLCIVTPGFPLGIPLSCVFPNLEELSWMGTTLHFDPAAGSLPALILPTLKRAHFVLSDTTVDAAVITLAYAELPSLTHLRISEFSYRNMNMIATLATALGQSSHQDALTPQSSSTSHLRLPRIIIQSTPTENVGWSAHDDHKWATLTTQLQALALAQNQGNDRARVLLLPRPLGSGQWLLRMRSQWLERTQGGCGCWVESEAEETASEWGAPRVVPPPGWEMPS